MKGTLMDDVRRKLAADLAEMLRFSNYRPEMTQPKPSRVRQPLTILRELATAILSETGSKAGGIDRLTKALASALDELLPPRPGARSLAPRTRRGEGR